MFGASAALTTSTIRLHACARLICNFLAGIFRWLLAIGEEALADHFISAICRGDFPISHNKQKRAITMDIKAFKA